MQNSKKCNIICYNCTAFVIDKDKAYCEEDNFDDEPVQKAKTFEPVMFDCILFEKCPE